MIISIITKSSNRYCAAEMPRNPDWLESLRGESPLLSKSEWDYIAKVRSGILQKSPPTEANFRHLPHRVSCMVDNFEKVVKYLRESSERKDYFSKTYPEWKSVRESSISQLSSIATSINYFNKDSAVDRTLGHTVSLVGGAIALAGRNNLLTLLLGGGIGLLGTTISTVSSLVEFQNVQQKLKEAQKVLEEDLRYSKKLFGWLSDGSYAQEAINDIKSQVIDLKIREVIHELKNIYEHYRNTKLDEVDKKIANVLKRLDISPEKSKEVADVVGILLALFILCKHHDQLFKVASEMYDLFKGAFKMTASAFEFLHLASEIKNGTGAFSTTKQIAVGISMALHVVHIFLALKDFDSVSKQVKLISKAKYQLCEEKRVFANIFSRINYN